MKLFSAIVVLATLMGTMYGYVLGRIASRPLQTSKPDFWLASEYPAFLREDDFWGQIIYWSALPLFLLFAWLTIKYVSETYLRDQKVHLQEQTIGEVQEFFREVSHLSQGKGDSQESKG